MLIIYLFNSLTIRLYRVIKSLKTLILLIRANIQNEVYFKNKFVHNSYRVMCTYLNGVFIRINIVDVDHKNVTIQME